MAKKKRPQKTGLDAAIERDFTALHAAGELEPAFEIDALVEEVSALLRAAAAAPVDYRRFPMIVGERGVGKTALVRELVRRNEKPVQGRRVILVDFTEIADAAGPPIKERERREAIEKTADALHEAADEVLPVVVGLSTLQFYANRKLAGLLEDPDALFIVKMSQGEYRKLVEEMPIVARRFLPVNLSEPDPPTLERLLTQWAAHSKDRLGVKVDSAAIEIAVELTNRFLPGHAQPRKSIDLLSAAATASAGRRLKKDTVLDWFSTIHAVPRFLVNPDEPLELEDTEAFFRQRLIGQEDAVKAVLRMIAIIKAGVGDTSKPLGTFLFVGPTGVGKTHIAQLLAEYLFGSRHAMLRLNMTDYSEPHEASLLFGNPWGETLGDRQGVLAQRLVAHPFGVLLLDELEKANPLVLDRLFQLVDEGRYRNANGDMVYCTTLVLIATSNAGAQVFRERSIGFLEPGDEQELVPHMMTELERSFRFEFLNRFDSIVAFRPLRRGEIRELARREMSELLERTGIKRRRLDVEVDENVLDLLASHGYDPLYGARFLRREIERRVVGPLAETLVRQNPPAHSRLLIAARGNRITFQVSRGNEAVPVRAPEGDKVERLEPAALRERATEMSAGREPLATSLDELRARAEELLARTRDKRFWDEPAQARQVLEEYRNIDLTLQTGRRALQLLEHLTDLAENGGRDPARLAAVIEQATVALDQWRDLTVDGGGPVWLLIGPADALQVDSSLVEKLARTYLSWSRRCGIDTEVVGEQVNAQGQLLRVALLAEAPHAHAVFAMEQGVHRFVITPKKGRPRSSRVLVDVLPVQADDGREPPGRILLADARHAEGVIVTRVSVRCTVEIPERALELEFRGGDRNLLEGLGRAIVARPAADPEVARVYGEGGTGARDPRTGAVSARLRDVWSGDLSRFLTAWRDADDSRRRPPTRT